MALRNIHEDFSRRGEIEAGSERTFGIVFFAVFAIMGLYPLLNGGEARIWALIIAGAFLLAALVAPRILRPLNRLWSRFGLLLHNVVSPVIMGLLFFVAVTPTALIMRLAGKDPLRLRFDPEARTYWIDRQPPGPEPKTMRNQF